MTALQHYRTAETMAWEQKLPQDESIIAQGLLKKSPFPIIDLIRSRKNMDLLDLLSRGADLRIQRKAWSIIAREASRLNTRPHWVNSGFDEVVTKLCYPNLSLAQVKKDISWHLLTGKSVTCEQVLKAWNQQTSLSLPMQQVAVHHLWLESHPQRETFTPEMLGKGQILMMALSVRSPEWMQLVPAKARDAVFSVDLGI